MSEVKKKEFKITYDIGDDEKIELFTKAESLSVLLNSDLSIEIPFGGTKLIVNGNRAKVEEL